MIVTAAETERMRKSVYATSNQPLDIRENSTLSSGAINNRLAIRQSTYSIRGE